MQTLVGAAGEALGIVEDPLTTLVGSKICEATRDELETEDWGLNMEICDIINHTEEGPDDAVKAIKKRLHQCMGRNSKTALYTLTILETCVKNCRRPFLVLICSREFATDLSSLECPSAVKEQVLGLLQSWARVFSSDPALQGVVELVNEMKARGVTFPAPTTQHIVLTSAQSNLVPCHGPIPPVGSGLRLTTRHSRQQINYGKLNDDQVRKLKQDLEIAQVNVDVLNELLTELSPGQEHPEDRDLLEELGVTCREMQRRVVELVGVVDNRELTTILLEVNDNLNNQMLRYERYKTSEQNNPTSTDEVLLEMAGGQELMGATAIEPTTVASEYQDVDLLGFDDQQKHSEKIGK